MKLSYIGTATPATAKTKAKQGQVPKEYILQDSIKFPHDINYSVIFRAECKIKRRIQFSLVGSYDDVWVTPTGFNDMGTVSPRPPSATWRETIYNYVVGQPAQMFTFNKPTLNRTIQGNICNLVVIDVDGVKNGVVASDCPFDQIRWTFEIVANRTNEIFL